MLAAIDFTTIEVWTTSGLVTYYLLFVMRLATRQVEMAGCTPFPNEAWMKQIARNLTGCGEGLLRGLRYLPMDRDANFSAAFREILKSGGVASIRLQPRSPNLNAHLEQFHLSIKSECLEELVLFRETMLRTAVRECLPHHHAERNHQELATLQPDPRPW